METLLCRGQEGPVVPSEKVCGSLGHHCWRAHADPCQSASWRIGMPMIRSRDGHIYAYVFSKFGTSSRSFCGTLPCLEDLGRCVLGNPAKRQTSQTQKTHCKVLRPGGWVRIPGTVADVFVTKGCTASCQGYPRIPTLLIGLHWARCGNARSI